jgi:hypothetical protein
MGFTQEEFDEIIDYAAGFFGPALPDPERQEDVAEAMGWFYRPWPYVDDREKNRYAVGEV